MSAAREKDQSDFDLERFVDMFDEAMTSRDPRVIDALRGLMMIVTLTRPESRDSGLYDRNTGPLRRLFEDMNHLHRRLERLEEEHRQLVRQLSKPEINYNDYSHEKYSMQTAIDQDLLNQLRINTATKPRGLK